MAVNFGPGLHSAAGQRVDRSAYDRYLGRWSRLFVPATLTAAEVGPSHRTLDVATGPGEAASMALARVGPAGLVVGVDISLAMRVGNTPPGLRSLARRNHGVPRERPGRCKIGTHGEYSTGERA
jgi:SAM-dependent methyltransferase